jgi:hypothetical protein
VGGGQAEGLDSRGLSFVARLRIVRDALYEFAIISHRRHAQLSVRLLWAVADERLTRRRLRSNPRVVRREMSKLRLKRPEHARWPQPHLPFTERVLLI